VVVLLSPYVLNRTLLHRQHLLARSSRPPIELVDHLIGLQAQETLPPYLSLSARLHDFDPQPVSEAIGNRDLVRLLAMRGTIHLLTPEDALTLRQFTQTVNDRERKSSQNTKPALHLDTDTFNRAATKVLAGGPLPVKELGLALAEHFPDTPPNALGQLARVNLPIAQLPPRGQWRASGGVVYQLVHHLLDRPLIDPDPEEIVRRYLRAFGPSAAADVTAWSSAPRMAPLLKGMTDLVEHHDEAGKVLYDVPDGEIVDDAPAPVRLLGTYDNVWLSHAARDRVTTPEKRTRWMGANGGVASALFVDGMLEGLWRVIAGKPEVIQEFRTFTRSERSELDVELARVEALLARD
jgi:hypothetical protein